MTDAPDPEIAYLPPPPARRPEMTVEPERQTRVVPSPKVLPLPKPPGVAIVLTGRQPAYADVAYELGGMLKQFSIYDLSDKSQSPDTAFKLINDSDSGAVVAIGLAAARYAVALSSLPVVYCQVFNYRDNDLVRRNSRGVAALAPLDAHLAAWKQKNPSIQRVGAIIGPDHADLIAEAHLAADAQGIQLSIEIVRSDQEALYQFRRMVVDIDGFWLFPDNRILSARSLKEIFAQAQRRKVDVAVTNDALLQLGASISFSTVAADIAATILDVLRHIEAGELARIPDITPLSAIQVVAQ